MSAEKIKQNILSFNQLVKMAGLFLKNQPGMQASMSECQRGIMLAPASGEKFFVSWTDIGQAGIRSLKRLFDEFSDGKPAYRSLAQHKPKVFDPIPYGPDSESLFLPEPYHFMLFRLWAKQREDYLAKAFHITRPISFSNSELGSAVLCNQS